MTRSQPCRIGIAILGLVLACSRNAPAQREPSSWPTLHRDAQRSGYTDEVVGGPYERKWFRDFHDEMIATRVEAIVAGGRCFVGTLAGRLHALRVGAGATAWTFQAAGPIGHSPCFHGGRVYVGSEGGAFDRGFVYGVDAGTGRELWRYETGGGVSVSPACDGERVYFGDRAGAFHCVAAADGRSLWRFQTGGMILTPASIAEDGQRVVFAAEDMHIYCLDPGGKLLWKSRKLPGLSLRDHAPTLWRGLAIVRTNPADAFHRVMDRDGNVLGAAQKQVPLGDPNDLLLDKWGDYIVRPTPARRRAEQDRILAYLRENPADQCFHALSLADGSEPWMAPVLYTGGLHNPPTAPAFDPKTGELYTLARSAMTYYLRGVRRYSVWATVDRETGRLNRYWPEADEPLNWRAFPMIGDEAQALSLMGTQLVGSHQGMIGLVDRATGKATKLWDARDTYGGIFGPVLAGGLGPDGEHPVSEQARRENHLISMPNEWHGPDRSVVSIAERRVFWVSGSQVVCIGGPDTPKADTGGAKPPAPIKRRTTARAGGGNLAAGGPAPGDLPPAPATPVPQDAIDRMIDGGATAPAGARGPIADRVRAALDAQMLDLVDGGPWAPLIVQLGITGEERHYWRTAETLQVASRSLPHLTPAVREKAVAYLHRLFDDGVPLRRPVHPADGGRRREPFDLGAGMRRFAGEAPPYASGADDLYAVWAYAHHAGAWDKVLARLDAVRAAYTSTKPFRFDPEKDPEAAERLNARIAGTLGYCRILREAGKGDESATVERELTVLVRQRLDHERTDDRLVRRLPRLHGAAVPRFVGLVPELAAVLRSQAADRVQRNVRDLTTELPVWYQAWGERMIGGENYISPPGLARGLFNGLAYGCGASADELARYLDRPWCRADLAYAEKCVAVLDAAGRGQ